MTVRIMILALLLLAGRPAAGNVEFAFNQTGSTPVGAVVASGSIVLSDAAFASGVSISRNHMNPLTTDWNALGILGLNFATNGFTASLANLFPRPDPGLPFAWILNLSSSPFSTPTGTFYFNDTNSDMRFNLNGASSTGDFNSDFGGPSCGRTGVCHFTGTFVMVPEPASLALFGLGIVGLAALRRREGRVARTV